MLSLLLCPAVAEAQLRVDPRPKPPEWFYAIPERNIRTVLGRPLEIRRKLTGNPHRPWGPNPITFTPDISGGHWYLFAVCRGAIITRGKMVAETDRVTILTCP